MRNHPLLSFLILAFGISWSIYAIAKWGVGVSSTFGWTAVSALFMFGPALAAIILRHGLSMPWRDLGVVRVGIRWKWMGLAVLIPMALPPLTLFFNWMIGDVLGITAFGHTAVTKTMVLSVLEKQLANSGTAANGALEKLSSLPLNGISLLVITLITGALAGCTVNFAFAMGEELGWRGMLYRYTQGWGLWKHVIFTGTFWGLWHAPLILEGHNYPDHPGLGVAFMCLLTTALALPLAWVRFRSHCVWSAGVFQGTVNGVAGASVLFSQGSTNMLGSTVGISGILGLVVIGTTLFLFDHQFRKQFNAG